MQKLSGNGGEFLAGDGVWKAPIPASHNTTHQAGGGDAIKLDDLEDPDDNTDLNVTSSQHGLMHKLSGISGEYFDGDGMWKSVGDTINGTRQQDAESLSGSTNATTSYIQKLRLSMPADTLAGRYRIGWGYMWNISTVNHNFLGRVQVDDSTDLVLHVEEATDSAASQKKPGGGFAYVNLGAGAHTVDIDFAASNVLATATISDARLEVNRVS